MVMYLDHWAEYILQAVVPEPMLPSTKGHIIYLRTRLPKEACSVNAVFYDPSRRLRSGVLCDVECSGV